MLQVQQLSNDAIEIVFRAIYDPYKGAGHFTRRVTWNSLISGW